MTTRFPINICSKPFTSEDLKRVKELIKENPQTNRQRLSQIICREFGWICANGKLKEMSCRVAMLKLWRKGLIKLPVARRAHVNDRRIKTTSISDPRIPIEKAITDIKEIKIYSVITRKESLLWNELIERYHYLRYKPLPGAQIRYLISCEEGLLGAISFSASAWKVAPRDKWIGWDAIQREKNLHLIVNNSRYLILPWIRIRHLASKILSLCARRIRIDWLKRYAYEPVVLETFVEKDRFKGTCYKASNWKKVGQTQGRGKKDIHNKCELPIKDIWMYPLVKEFRERLREIG
jgi:hypothetical protein